MVAHLKGDTNPSYAHGMSRSRTYKSWQCMKDRCLNPKSEKWDRYGGRGIRVCKRWLKFENFLADMGERPEGTTLDRKNNNGNYGPGNCRWAKEIVQQRNKSNVKLDAIAAARIRQLLREGATTKWVATNFGVSQSTVSDIRRGRYWREE